MVIPKSISKQLLPNLDVVDAVRRSTYHIWPITIIDEAITLFADMNAGNLQDDGVTLRIVFTNGLSSDWRSLGRLKSRRN